MLYDKMNTNVEIAEQLIDPAAELEAAEIAKRLIDTAAELEAIEIAELETLEALEIAKQERLKKEFLVEASTARVHSNSIQQKLTELLQHELALVKTGDIVQIDASDLKIAKIHLQTMYNAIRACKIEVELGKTYTRKLVDSKNVKSFKIVKI